MKKFNDLRQLFLLTGCFPWNRFISVGVFLSIISEQKENSLLNKQTDILLCQSWWLHWSDDPTCSFFSCSCIPILPPSGCSVFPWSSCCRRWRTVFHCRMAATTEWGYNLKHAKKISTLLECASVGRLYHCVVVLYHSHFELWWKHKLQWFHFF